MPSGRAFASPIPGSSGPGRLHQINEPRRPERRDRIRIDIFHRLARDQLRQTVLADSGAAGNSFDATQGRRMSEEQFLSPAPIERATAEPVEAKNPRDERLGIADEL